MHKRSLLERLVIFAAVGSFCLLLQLGILELLKIFMVPFAADAVAFFCSAQVNFWLSYKLTWRDTVRVRGQALLRKWLSFIGAVSISMVANALVYTTVQPLSNDLVGVMVAAIASLVVSFTLNHGITFRSSGRSVVSSGRRAKFDSIAFFLPAYGEAKNLPLLVPEVVSYLRGLDCKFSVIVVNDGSPDDTGEVAEGLAAQYPDEVKVVHHEVNRGYGRALRTGLHEALTTSHSLIGFCDADLQFRIHSLGPMLEAIQDADAVFGYRLKRADSLKRRLMGRGWHHLSSFVLGFSARDVDCGFKLFRREVVETLEQSLRGEYATISAELILRIQRAGFQCVEVGVEHYPRHEGEQSGASLGVIVGSFKDLVHTYVATRGV